MHPLNIAALLLCAAVAGNASAQATPAAAPAKPDSGFIPPASNTGNVIDSIAVVVNDEVITRNEVAQRVAAIEQRLKAQNAQMPDAADMRRQVIEAMIVERAQFQLAKEMGIRPVDDTQLDRAIGRIAENQKMSVQDMRNAMEREGMSFAAFREEIRNEITLQRLRENEVDNKIQISEAEVDTYLAAEQAANADKSEVNISQILVRIPENASPEQIAARKARADEVSRQLRTGGDFAKLAGTYSESGDALQGGAIGWRDPDRLPPVFAQALAKLSPGQSTQVIRSTAGFHILKLVDRRSLAAEDDKSIVQQTRARHILLKVTPAMTAEAAKRKLTELKERLDNNAAKFEDLARLVSTDAAATKGGDLGWLYPGDTVPEFENAMNALKIGEVSGIVETPYGFHLIQVVERKSEDQSKEKKRAAARQVIRDRKLAEATEDWLRQVRDRAYVEFRDE
ncbi:peptidylprolyl isomerase [Massilia sp. PAMC28688]|uniref:peptidylprolyl isomerase n=1 Tax=Massilia sp. PAMC28688 TaxID=2861283 RepID=UPI001C6254A4|nr:peptidylprolyl isomerase [Massilia sp. PAMC28688]QYF95549.1 peptidylprolyl isomerase [Massilia sp. PAMC28688]